MKQLFNILLVLILAATTSWSQAPLKTTVQALGGELDTIEAEEAHRALVAASRRAVPALLEALRSGNPYHRARVLQVLGDIKDRRTELPIRRHLRSESSPLAQCRALEALGKIGNPASLLAILPFLDSPYRSVRAFAIWTIGELRAATSLAQILPFISPQQDPVLLRFAIEALAKVGSSKTQNRVVPYLRHGNGEIREVTARALGEIGNEAMIGDLFAQLDREPELQTQYSLVKAVGKIDGGYAIRQLAYLFENTRAPVRQHMAAEAFEAMGTDGAMILRDILEKSEDPNVQALAAQSLGRMGSGLANKRLLQLLKARNFRARMAAIYALARTGDASTLKPLIELAKSSNDLIREAAQKAIGRIQQRKTIHR